MGQIHSHSKVSKLTVAGLALLAIGIVYGDIGTSPIYSLNEIFLGRANLSLTPDHILGALSIVLWVLTLIITCKYVMFVLRADNNGDGGVFSLLDQLSKLNLKRFGIIIGVMILAAGLLLGEGIITPAISVLSAVEGLKVITPSFAPFVIPITIAILVALFGIQYKGTKYVGIIFAPIMVLWFIAIALLGIFHIWEAPQVFLAFDPMYGFHMLLTLGLLRSMLVLGGVMLVITGGEALFADLGHFGKLPIRLSWLFVVYPALMLNYLGQGAYLLHGGKIVEGSIFFSMVPARFLLSMVVLAMFATVIASQALISGAFSLIAQAISLNLFPRLTIHHKNRHHEGQIYLPFVNWFLFAGAIILIIAFRSSANLAAAYGLSVSGVMMVTSLMMIILSHKKWHWPLAKSISLFGFFALIDITFFSSNLLKFTQGGYVPVILGLSIFTVMATWRWGRSVIINAYNAYLAMDGDQTFEAIVEAQQALHLGSKVECLGVKEVVELPRGVIFLVKRTITNVHEKLPPILRMFIHNNGAIPKYIFLLNIHKVRIPHIDENKYEIFKLTDNIYTIHVDVGFMDTCNTDAVFNALKEKYHFNYDFEGCSLKVGEYEIKLDKSIRNIFTICKTKLFNLISLISVRNDKFFKLDTEFTVATTIIPIEVDTQGSSIHLP